MSDSTLGALVLGLGRWNARRRYSLFVFEGGVAKTACRDARTLSGTPIYLSPQKTSTVRRSPTASVTSSARGPSTVPM